MIRKIFTLTSALFLFALNNAFSQERIAIDWNSIGPSAYVGEQKAGNVKAILAYKSNPSQLVVGTATGGLWYSENDGTDWKQSTLDINANNFSCGAQGSDGVMYFGTGSYDTVFAVLQPIVQTGKGIYKSTDGGKNFTLLTSTIPSASNTTVPFAFVNKIAVDPDNSNNVYAATNKGIYRTTDGGTSWAALITDDANMAFDVEVGKSGFVLASIRNRVYMSTDGTNFNAIAGLDLTNLYKVKLAISQADNNYAYIATMTNVGMLGKIYQTINKGGAWSVFISGGSQYFEPFNAKGGQSSCFGLYPGEKDKLFIGGFCFFTYSVADGWVKRLLNGNSGSINSVDFNVDKGYGFFATNRGIFRSPKGGYNIFDINDFSFFSYLPFAKGISIADVYDVAFSGSHYFHSLGDNGIAWTKAYYGTSKVINTNLDVVTALYNKKGSNKIIAVGPYGNIQTSIDSGDNYTTGVSIFTSRQIKYLYQERYVDNPNLPKFAEERAPVSFIEAYRSGQRTSQTTLCLNSDITIKTPGNQAKSFFDDKATLWVTRNLHSDVDAALWYKVAFERDTNPLSSDFVGKNVALETSSDLDIVYAAMFDATTSSYILYRIKGINTVYDNPTTYGKDTLMELGRNPVFCTKIANFGSRPITSINVDPNNSGKLIVTLGGIGFTSNLYRSTIANSCAEANDLSNFELAQGDLASMPIYDAVVDVNNSDRVLLATYEGVKVCDNAFSSGVNSQVWSDANGIIPVGTVINKINQDACPYEVSGSRGLLMVATMGKGTYSSTSLVGTKEVTTVRNSVSIYPNPASQSAFVSFGNTSGETQVKVMDINGRVVLSKNVSSQSVCEINTSSLQSGTYFVTVNNNEFSKTEKLVVIR